MNSLPTFLSKLAKQQSYNIVLSMALCIPSLGITGFVMTPTAAAFSLTSYSDTGSSELGLSSKTGFEHESTDLIANGLYARPSSTYSGMALDGSNRKNSDYAAGLSDQWYIEEQRFGKDALISGLLHDDSAAISAGLKMFDWGFAQQNADGSFCTTEDKFHSTSMFVESVSYSLLALKESPYSDQYAAVAERYKPALQSAAKWMIQADVLERGLSNNSPYTHRDYVVASALGLTGKLTGDQDLIDYGNQQIIAGLVRQTEEGVNPEKDGHDSSYQMAGVNYAMRWLAHFANNTLAPAVTKMLSKALMWEESRILETGEVSAEGNTRTGGQEVTRIGEEKHINHREIIHGFSYAASLTGDLRWEADARKVASYYYIEDPKVMEIASKPIIATAGTKPTVEDVFESPEKENKSQSVPEPASLLGLLLFAPLGLLYASDYKRNRESIL